MNFLEAAQQSEVRLSLQQIEDKLLETGRLTKATGDNEAEITIAYREFECDGEIGPYLLIEITSEDGEERDESVYEAISDYVSDKIGGSSGDWGAGVEDALINIYGQVVLFNGKSVY